MFHVEFGFRERCLALPCCVWHNYVRFYMKHLLLKVKISRYHWTPCIEDRQTALWGATTIGNAVKKWPEERKRARARLRRIAKEQSFSHCHPLEIGDIFVRSYYGQITCSMSIKGFGVACWGHLNRTTTCAFVPKKERKNWFMVGARFSPLWSITKRLKGLSWVGRCYFSLSKFSLPFLPC